jgi:hypothetical protein
VISAQLLFAEPLDDRTLRLDMVVLARWQPDHDDGPAGRPPLGSPFTLDLSLPSDLTERLVATTIVSTWASWSAFAELAVVEHHGVAKVLLAVGDGAVLLEQSAAQARPGRARA